MKYIIKGQNGIAIQKNDVTKTVPSKLKPKSKEPVINTTSEMINGRFNPNAHMGLDIVSPEFALAAAPVGAINLGTSALAKIGGAAIHGAAQGAVWNAAGMGGEQSWSGLAGDIAGGALIGGAIKGTPIAAKYLKGEYYKHTFDPMTVNLQKYKGMVAPNETMNLIDKSKSKFLSKKIDNIYNKTADSFKALPYEEKLQSIRSENNLKVRSKLLHDSQIGKSVGNPGAFGEAFSFKYKPDYVVKFGSAPAADRPLELVKLGEQFAKDPNIGMPLRVEQLAPNKYATVMRKMPGNFEMRANSVPRKSVAEAALQIRALNKAGIGFDYKGQNILFDEPTKKLSLIDLNVLPENPNMSDYFTNQANKIGQNPASLLKEKLESRMELKKPNK